MTKRLVLKVPLLWRGVGVIVSMILGVVVVAILSFLILRALFPEWIASANEDTLRLALKAVFAVLWMVICVFIFVRYGRS